MTTTPTSSPDVGECVRLFRMSDKASMSIALLKELLPDIETALFFAKVYDLDAKQLSELLQIVHNTSVVKALSTGSHSTELQSYLVDTVGEVVKNAKPAFVDKPTPGDVLPELWAAMQTDVAASIRQVAEKMKHTIGLLPGKQGRMMFNHLMQFNKQRPTIGNYAAQIKHPPQKPNLVILDDSGSMTRPTISAILADVIDLSWKADAHLVLISSSARHWEPGGFTLDAVLAQAQLGGTHYERLAPLLQQNWGTVVTIADYDSASSVKRYIAENCTGHIDEVLDISLVDRPTYLAECVGQLADNVHPLLIANSYRPLT